MKIMIGNEILVMKILMCYDILVTKIMMWILVMQIKCDDILVM